MAFVLISGVLAKEPEHKTSKTGSPYVSATLRVRDGAVSTFWRVTAFDAAVRAKLMLLREGDALSVQGQMRAEVWQPESGEARVNLSVVADNVLAARQPKKAQPKRYPQKRVSPVALKEKTASLDRAVGDGVDVFGDALPF